MIVRDGTRTRDQELIRLALYQLSYAHTTMRALVALALPIGILASPLSTLECLCPRACAINVVTPTCLSPIAIQANSTSGGLVDWFGATSMLSALEVTNFVVRSPAAISCAQSFYDVFNGTTRIVAAAATTQTSTTACTVSLTPASGNLTLFIGLRQLGYANVTLARVPFTGRTLFTISAVVLAGNGQHSVLIIAQLTPLLGCCLKPAFISFDATGGAAGGDECAGLTGTLNGDGNYDLQVIPITCATSVTVVGTNTVYVFAITVTTVASCAGNTFVTNPSQTAVQYVPLPASYNVAITSTGYTEAGCPFTESGFVKPFVYVQATSRYDEYAPSSATILAKFDGINAVVGTPVMTNPVAGTRVFTWRVTTSGCFPTVQIGCGATPVFIGSASAEFDHAGHTGDVNTTFGSTCDVDVPFQTCVLNNTQSFLPQTSQLSFVNLFRYAPTQPITLSATVASTDLVLAVDTVVVRWQPATTRTLPQTRTFSARITPSLFCVLGCDARTCAYAFRFTPADYGMGELTHGAGYGVWTVWTSAAVNRCPFANTLEPALDQFDNVADIVTKTPGCLPLALAAQQTVYGTTPVRAQSDAEFIGMVSGIVVGSLAFIFFASAAVLGRVERVRLESKEA